MRTLLLVATVLALFALAVGGVSAHDGNQDGNQMNEMMDRCLEMMDHMGGMMGSNSMANDEQSESMDTELEHQNDAIQNGESSHTQMGCC